MPRLCPFGHHAVPMHQHPGAIARAIRATSVFGPSLDPMDFSAWFQAYFGGSWYTFHARHNKPRIGRILMATARDATDVALSTSLGQSNLIRFDSRHRRGELVPGENGKLRAVDARQTRTLRA